MKTDILWESQMAALRELEVNLISLIKVAKETQSQIRNHGLEHNYSQNHDCYYYSTRVWKYSLRLAELKKLEMQLNGYDTLGLKPKKQERT